MDRGRVYIANTGGTIGMRHAPGGWRPEPGHLAEQLARMPELQTQALPAYTLGEHEPLIDSSDMTPAHWERIAADIEERYDDYDGFVVLHGTDTMAYTASALSFMLGDLAKPVILTGSQIPLCEVRNDARENLIDALMIAGGFKIPEVCILFQGQLLRGNRTVKMSADGLDAFASPNCSPLGHGGVHIRINWNRLRAVPDGPLHVRALKPAKVAALRIFPGIDADLLRHYLKPPLQGLVLECYGRGNAPQDPKLLEVIREATARGVVVVVCSQCPQGTVQLGGYATSSGLARAGAIGASDMTTEAAMPKLFYLFAQGLEPQDVKSLMPKDLRGELTAPGGPAWADSDQ